jgi:acyl-CoA reductase-like NAD-dependent aldehyde dehydrogenase
LHGVVFQIDAQGFTLPDASPAQVDAAVEAATKAFQTWSRTTPAERSALLLKLANARAPSRRSSTTRSGVTSFVDRSAKEKHISITAGGKAPVGKGFCIDPRVVAGAKQDDEIVRKEVFGPVGSVTSFDDGGFAGSRHQATARDLSMYALEDYTVARHVMVKL